MLTYIVLSIAVVTLNGQAVDGNVVASKVTSAIQLVSTNRIVSSKFVLIGQGTNNFSDHVCCYLRT
jgi:hypothetical protein